MSPVDLTWILGAVGEASGVVGSKEQNLWEQRAHVSGKLLMFVSRGQRRPEPSTLGDKGAYEPRLALCRSWLPILLTLALQSPWLPAPCRSPIPGTRPQGPASARGAQPWLTAAGTGCGWGLPWSRSDFRLSPKAIVSLSNSSALGCPHEKMKDFGQSLV